MAGRFSVESVFKAVDRVTAPVSRMQQRVSKFTRSVRRGLSGVNKGFSKLHAGIKKAGRAFVVGAGLIAGAGAVMAQSGLDFEQAITNVGAVALQTRAEIKPLEDLAKQLGATTKFTATQAANAMEVLARSGFSAQQILDSTPAVLSAAAASGLEIAEVADHVSNVLKGMGLEMTQASRVADVLALASARTNSTIGSLGESMRNVAATARQLGVPLESAVASVALLQDVGLDASVAGSAFNTMLTKMAKPSKEIAGLMRRFGVSFKDAKGDMLPLNAVLEQLSAASKKVGGNFDKVAFLADLVGLRGQKAAANLADLFDEGKVAALTKELENATGTADKMAKIRMDTTRGSLTLLASAVDAVKVQIFDLNSGPLKDTIDKMTQWVGTNQDLIATKVTDFIADIVIRLPEIWTWIKRIGKALVVFYAFSAALQTLTGVFTLLNLVMAANPVGLIVIGVVAAISVLAALWAWPDKVAAKFDALPSIFKVAFAPIYAVVKAVQWLSNNMGSIVGAARAAVDWAGGIFGPDQESVSPADSQVVSPQERSARAIEERRATSTAEVTIRDETKRAEVTRGKLGTGVQLQQSGAF